MPGPATLFTTLGAVGACGAAAYVTKNHQILPTSRTELPKRNQEDQIINHHFSSRLTSTNKKMRLGGHRNDLHVLTFVMGKD